MSSLFSYPRAGGAGRGGYDDLYWEGSRNSNGAPWRPPPPTYALPSRPPTVVRANDAVWGNFFKRTEEKRKAHVSEYCEVLWREKKVIFTLNLTLNPWFLYSSKVRNIYQGWEKSRICKIRICGEGGREAEGGRDIMYVDIVRSCRGC